MGELRIRQVDPDDDAAVAAWAQVRNSGREADAPWQPPLTPGKARADLVHGWDGEPAVGFLAVLDDAPVASGSYSVFERDNRHLAWLGLHVVPERRRRGLGSELLGFLEEQAIGLGRTSLGLSCWEHAGYEPFALRHGYARKQVGVNRVQYLDDVDPSVVDRIHDEAVRASSGYELVRLLGPAPEELLEELAVMTAAINDAPTDDLDIEDDVFDADRIRAYDTAQTESGWLLHRLVARHRESGELVGQTVVAVDTEDPRVADQHDTSVVGAHRGHRLGALLKTGMLQWLGDEQPQVREISTWNATSNDHMIGVNEQLGYRVMGRELNLQKSARLT